MGKKFNLKIIEGNNVDSVFELEEGVRYELRRLPVGDIPTLIDKRKTIFLDDPEISKAHASIVVVAGELIVQDLNSTNGIYVNNKKVSKTLLSNKDRLKIGNTVLMVSKSELRPADDMTFVGRAPSKYSKQTHDFKKLSKALDEKVEFNPPLKIDSPYPIDSKASSLFFECMDIVSKNKKLLNEEEILPEMVDGYAFKIKFLNGVFANEEMIFYRKKIIIGRTKDLYIPDDSVSREHAELSVYGKDSFKIKDLNSQNGTFVNHLKVQTASFKDGDTVKLGDTMLSFSHIKENF
jgi:pSer/pThr/pTyr-binding forkhead associated (FHA) protein